MNHSGGGDCHIECVSNEQHQDVLQNIILRLRPADVPSINSKLLRLYNSVATVFSILSLNILGAVTLISIYLSVYYWSEMRVALSFEIFYASIGLLAVCFMKFLQCLLNLHTFSKQRDNVKVIGWINIFMYLPCIVVLWLSLACTQSYHNRSFSVITAKDTNGMNWNKEIPKFPSFTSLYDFQSDPYIKNAWNQLQTKYSCCGSYGYKDYVKNSITPPLSCYEPGKPKLQEKGCLPAVNTILFSLCYQLHNIILWFLLPIEGWLVFFGILGFYSKMCSFWQPTCRTNCQETGPIRFYVDSVERTTAY